MARSGWSRRAFVKTVSAAGVAAALRYRPASAAAPDATAPPGPRGAMRFGVQTHPQQVAYKEMVDVWKQADDLGFDSLFAFDHFMPINGDPSGSCFEGWTLLSALATQTVRARVGLLVTGNTYRYPAIVAKMTATVDHVSNGRAILGLGAGWFELEHTAYGIPFYTPGERAHRLAEAVQVVKLLFTQEKSNFSGKYYQLKDALFAPKTVQKPHPPILIGGMGPKVVQPLAARHADIWHFFVNDTDPGGLKKVCEDFDALCRKVGRDPTQVEKATSLRSAQLTGSGDEVRARVQALAGAGVRHVILSLGAPYDRAVLRRFAQEVMPAFRAA